MDRAVVIARSPPPLEIHREKLRATSAKIRKVTEPEETPWHYRGGSLHPEEPEATPYGPKFVPKNRATPYDNGLGRSKSLSIPVISDRRPLPPRIEISPTPVPPTPVLPTNGPLNHQNYAQLAHTVRERSASSEQIPQAKARSLPPFVKTTQPKEATPWHHAPLHKSPSPEPPVPTSSSRLLQRSSRSRSRGLGKTLEAPETPQIPQLVHVPRGRPTAPRRAEDAPSIYEHGHTPDKRFKGAGGEVRRIPRPRGLNRRARSALALNIRNRD